MEETKVTKRKQSISFEGTKDVGAENGHDNSIRKARGDGDKAISGNVKSFDDRLYKKKPTVAVREPELHVIGELQGGYSLGTGVCCRWQFDYGNMWIPLDGNIDGQTQVDYPSDGNMVVWCHPLDVHFLCKGLQGWPRLLLQVWNIDEIGRLHLAGYGFVHIPNMAGSFEMEVTTWRPVGTLKEEIATLFLGTTPNLRDIDVLYRKAWSHRNRITTQSSGVIRLKIDVVLRSFSELNVDK